MRRGILLAACAAAAAASAPKRGLSGLAGCGDAAALGLENSWHYNWGPWPTRLAPDGSRFPPGTPGCQQPLAAEFVPMFWGWGGGNLTAKLWPTFREDWRSVGVTHVLGWNEPDNKGQANMSPAKAAEGWAQLDALAQSFSPPLTLVGPGMTHWGDDGGSPWLDQFLGNLSADVAGRIRFLAQHDYSGNGQGIVAKAEAARKKYGRQVWLTEFAVGSSAPRARNDAFAREALPLFDQCDAIARYAWFSARNTGSPTSWVYESNLLNASDLPGGWVRRSMTACGPGEQVWLGQHVTPDACEAATLSDERCAEPKTAIAQSGDVQNCYCANTTDCHPRKSSWQDMYVLNGAPPPAWTETKRTTCSANELTLLKGNVPNAIGCQALAEAALECSMAPVKVVAWSTGAPHSCRCLSAASCTHTPDAGTSLFTSPPPPTINATLTSTGFLYAAKPAS